MAFIFSRRWRCADRLRL